MYTDCPACERQFRIHAEQLSAAQGLVKCGYCGETFNALERLRDKPIPQSAEAKQTPIKPESREPEPQFDIPVESQASAIGALESQEQVLDEQAAQNQTETHEQEKIAPETANTTQPLEIEEVRAQEQSVTIDIAEAEENITPDETDSAEVNQEEAIAAFDFPTPDTTEQVIKKSPLLHFFQIVVLLLLLTVLTLQLAWFNRDLLLKKYPQLYPWAEKVCTQLDCTIVRFRDLAAVKVLNRDVRLHPRYENALLVNATIVNTAKYVQPFPVVQLTLFDTNGKVMAHRDFNPQDYLDQNYLNSAGMQPDAPIHFVLELSGFSTKAVGFEFNFM